MPTTATEPLYVTLSETRSYSRRRAGWFPGPKDGQADSRLGTLRIVCEKVKGGADVDEYGVERDYENVPPDGRAFLLKNDTDSTQPDVYKTVVTPTAWGCTCKAGTVGRHRCKHADAVQALIEKGVPELSSTT